MNEKVDGWKDELIDGWMNEWIAEWEMSEWNSCMDGWWRKHKLMTEWMEERVNKNQIELTMRHEK